MSKIRIAEIEPEYPVTLENEVSSFGKRIGVIRKHRTQYVFVVDEKMNELVLSENDLNLIASRVRQLNNPVTISNKRREQK